MAYSFIDWLTSEVHRLLGLLFGINWLMLVLMKLGLHRVLIDHVQLIWTFCSL